MPLVDLQGQVVCEICNESISKFFNEDSDTWMLRNAVYRNEMYYHGIKWI